MGLLSDAEDMVAWLDGMMWKLAPESVLSILLGSSTLGKACRSRLPELSLGGGVSACCNGDAVYDWNCEPSAKGGKGVRTRVGGELKGEAGICSDY